MDILTKIMNDGENDYFSLSDGEQDIFLLASFTNAVNDGNFLTFYQSDCGAYHEQLLELLNFLNLDEAAFVLDSLGAIFPDGYPPEDNEERREILEELVPDYGDLFSDWNDQIRQFAKELEAELKKLLENIQ